MCSLNAKLFYLILNQLKYMYIKRHCLMTKRFIFKICKCNKIVIKCYGRTCCHIDINKFRQCDIERKNKKWLYHLLCCVDKSIKASKYMKSHNCCELSKLSIYDKHSPDKQTHRCKKYHKCKNVHRCKKYHICKKLYD
jgi:hypothetical protein